MEDRGLDVYLAAKTLFYAGCFLSRAANEEDETCLTQTRGANRRAILIQRIVRVMRVEILPQARPMSLSNSRLAKRGAILRPGRVAGWRAWPSAWGSSLIVFSVCFGTIRGLCRVGQPVRESVFHVSPRSIGRCCKSHFPLGQAGIPRPGIGQAHLSVKDSFKSSLRQRAATGL